MSDKVALSRYPHHVLEGIDSEKSWPSITWRGKDITEMKKLELIEMVRMLVVDKRVSSIK